MLHKHNDVNTYRVPARRFDCNLTQPLTDVLRNPEEDSEVRIASYLGLMRCASYDTVATVRDLLHSEEVNQGEHDTVATVRDLLHSEEVNQGEHDTMATVRDLLYDEEVNQGEHDTVATVKDLLQSEEVNQSEKIR